MTEEAFLFLLRITVGMTLLGFVGLVGVMLWRDYRQTAKVLAQQTIPKGRLVVLQSGLEDVSVGHSWPLQTVTTVGRASRNTITLDEPFASHDHALVEWRSGQWWLEDLNSSNGTLLNGEPVNDPTVLSSGDVIIFGRVHLSFELE